MTDINLPKLSREQNNLSGCEGIKKELRVFLNKMGHNKITSNDGLTKKFHEIFWFEFKTLLLLFFRNTSMMNEALLKNKLP